MSTSCWFFSIERPPVVFNHQFLVKFIVVGSTLIVNFWWVTCLLSPPPPHSCVGGTDNVKHENEIDLFEAIDENVSYVALEHLDHFSSYKMQTEIDHIFLYFLSVSMQESKHKRTDRSVLLYLRKAQPGKPWPRLTKEKAKVSWTQTQSNIKASVYHTFDILTFNGLIQLIVAC